MEEKRFAELKVKYKATKYSDSSPASYLYKVLKKIDADSQLGEQDIKFLLEQKLTKTLKIVSKMEEKRKFAELKVKYKATKNSDSSPASHLYEVLKKIDADSQLGNEDIKFLLEHKLMETLKIVSQMEKKRKFAELFAELKIKYKATENLDSSLDSHLYKVLKKIEVGEPLSEADVNWLKKNGQTETLEIGIEKYAASLKHKIEAGKQLSKADINWLKKNGRYAASLKHKIEAGKQLSKADIDWLRKNGQTETLAFWIEKHAASLTHKIEAGKQLSEADIGLSNILGFVCRLLTVQFHSYSESLAIGGWTGATVLVEFCGDPDRRNPVSGHKQAISTPGYITFVSLFNLGS